MARSAKILFMPVQHPDGAPETPIDAAGRERRARWVLGAIMLGALGLFWAGAAISRHEDTSGIRALAPEVRLGLYARTLDELSTICHDAAAGEGALHDHCVAQARFILELPECNGACQRIAAAGLPHARR